MGSEYTVKLITIIQTDFALYAMFSCMFADFCTVLTVCINAHNNYANVLSSPVNQPQDLENCLPLTSTVEHTCLV